MGCSSSVHVKQNGDAKGDSPPKTKQQIKANELTDMSADFTNGKELVASNPNSLLPDCNSNMDVKTIDERSRGDGATSTEPSQNESNGVLQEEFQGKEEDADSTKEAEDSFDVSLKPLSHTKEHATQDTLNFVYKHGMSSSPSHLTGNFPALSSGAFGSPATTRYDKNRRRASGVPPPARELKPSDFLYKKTLNMKHDMSMTKEEDDEEET